MHRLPKRLRPVLAKPLGEVILGDELLRRVAKRRGLLISIGDTCTYFLLKNNVLPDIFAFDLKNMRKPVTEEVREALLSACSGGFSVPNPPGEITDELFAAVEGCIDSGRGCIFVDGEEDLAALVALMLAPYGSLVIYGQPDEGVVFMECSETLRKTAAGLFERMV